ncbi:DNA-binding response OmpR family regulator [Rhizobium sp. BK512]|jgi:DNA-binding response OmpR family regulator|uniref:hypothetical protein n=1 Tax=Rhizobium sp. BK512 TaxID=2587010 RepID=UPI0018070112|nr:hypothetical protein [Rhizobium sp. BK512]MBB3564967.1 DNA-binding response OmpR family regulator [Rhizobium sp. BK512]
MSEQTFRGRRVLVVEDEYLLAEELRVELEEEGAVVIGPPAGSTQSSDSSKASIELIAQSSTLISAATMSFR